MAKYLSSSLIFVAVLLLIITPANISSSTEASNGAKHVSVTSLWNLHRVLPCLFACSMTIAFVAGVLLWYWHKLIRRNTTEQRLITFLCFCPFLLALSAFWWYYSPEHSIISLVTHAVLDGIVPLTGVLFHTLTMEFSKRLKKHDGSLDSLENRTIQIHQPLAYFVGHSLRLDSKSIDMIKGCVFGPVVSVFLSFGIHLILHLCGFGVWNFLLVAIGYFTHKLSESATHSLYECVKEDLTGVKFPSQLRIIGLIMLFSIIQEILVAFLKDFGRFDQGLFVVFLLIEAVVCAVSFGFFFSPLIYVETSRETSRRPYSFLDENSCGSISPFETAAHRMGSKYSLA